MNKGLILFFVPCVLAFVLVHCQTGGYPGGYAAHYGGAGAGGLGGSSYPPGTYYNYALAQNNYRLRSGNAPRAPFNFKDWILPLLALYALFRDINNSTGRYNTNIFG